jgi:hypothetical protein
LLERERESGGDDVGLREMKLMRWGLGALM